MRFSSLLMTTLLFSVLACGDDDGGTDAGPINMDAGPPADAGNDGGNDAGPPSDAGNDAGEPDAGSDAGAMDSGAGPEIPTCGPGVEGTCCFDVSETLGDLPFVIPDTFDEATPTWNRPELECPAEMLSEDAVPYVAYTYCNKGDAAADFRFEVLAVDEDGLVPVIVAYSGTEINADPAMCGAYNEPLFGLAELILTLDPGQVVTIVSTTRDAPGTGEIQSIAGEPEE